MTLEFIAAIAAAFLGAGLGMILRWLSRGLLPRWIVPALAGAGMLGFSIWNEYAWYPRLVAGLPAGATVAEAGESRAPWRPWTHVVPLVERAVVVDHRRSMRNETAPDLLLTEVFLFGRWQDTRSQMVMFDCARPARVDVTAAVAFDADGTLRGGTWTPLDRDDPVLRTACDGG